MLQARGSLEELIDDLNAFAATKTYLLIAERSRNLKSRSAGAFIN